MFGAADFDGFPLARFDGSCFPVVLCDKHVHGDRTSWLVRFFGPDNRWDAWVEPGAFLRTRCNRKRLRSAVREFEAGAAERAKMTASREEDDA